jgi:hypothetical protein
MKETPKVTAEEAQALQFCAQRFADRIGDAAVLERPPYGYASWKQWLAGNWEEAYRRYCPSALVRPDTDAWRIFNEGFRDRLREWLADVD